MVSPERPEDFVRFDDRYQDEVLHLFVHRAVLQDVDPAARELIFCSELGWRYKLLLDGTAGAALEERSGPAAPLDIAAPGGTI
jgi:hypothetical protein